MRIGVIADDFTGATDIASFLVQNGLSTVQLCGVNDDIEWPQDVEAVVISHKSRSCPVKEALCDIEKSYNWLVKNHCDQFYFKYCSTFDSSKDGNIGPVTDFLMDKLKVDFTIFSPALPVNGRTVYKGYLFVNDTLLSESGMRNHPITPMLDSSVIRLVEQQSKGKCGLIDSATLDKGVDAVYNKFKELKQQGYKYAVVDAITTEHLITQGLAFKDMKLVTGGSGLAIGLARALTNNNINKDANKKAYPLKAKTVVFSGSCSVMTNKQVSLYRSHAASKLVDIEAIMKWTDFDNNITEYTDFVLEHVNDEYAPLVYATAEPDKLKEILAKYGSESSALVEKFFYTLAKSCKKAGIKKFIVAGGETSGTVTQSLDVTGFYIGPTIAPGVPWVKAINDDISLTLKSGNFGSEDFFVKAQKDF